MNFTENDLKQTAQFCGGKAIVLINEPKILKATFDVLKSIMKEKPDIAGLVSSTASGISNVVSKGDMSADTKTLIKSGSSTLSIFKLSLSLTQVTKITTVSGLLTFTGATLIQKTGVALSLAGNDNEKAKCYGALMELAGSAAATAVIGVSGPVLIGLTLASLAASAANAYGACNGVLWNKDGRDGSSTFKN